MGITAEKDPLHTELALARSIPRAWWSKAHSSMVLHGRRVCQAKKPFCEGCSLALYCSFYGKSGSRGRPVKSTLKNDVREEFTHEQEPEGCE